MSGINVPVCGICNKAMVRYRGGACRHCMEDTASLGVMGGVVLVLLLIFSTAQLILKAVGQK